jgi:hypothetical protein
VATRSKWFLPRVIVYAFATLNWHVIALTLACYYGFSFSDLYAVEQLLKPEYYSTIGISAGTALSINKLVAPTGFVRRSLGLVLASLTPFVPAAPMLVKLTISIREAWTHGIAWDMQQYYNSENYMSKLGVIFMSLSALTGNMYFIAGFALLSTLHSIGIENGTSFVASLLEVEHQLADSVDTPDRNIRIEVTPDGAKVARWELPKGAKEPRILASQVFATMGCAVIWVLGSPALATALFVFGAVYPSIIRSFAVERMRSKQTGESFVKKQGGSGYKHARTSAIGESTLGDEQGSLGEFDAPEPPPLPNGLYEIRTSTLFLQSHVGYGVGWGGVLHTNWHVTEGESITIEGHIYPCTAFNVTDDTAAYGGRPCLPGYVEGSKIFITKVRNKVSYEYPVQVLHSFEGSENQIIVSNAPPSVPGDSGTPAYQLTPTGAWVPFAVSGRGCVSGGCWAEMLSTPKSFEQDYNEVIRCLENPGTTFSLVKHCGYGKTTRVLKPVFSQAAISRRRVDLLVPTNAVAMDLTKTFNKHEIQYNLRQVKSNQRLLIRVFSHQSYYDKMLNHSIKLPDLVIKDEDGWLNPHSMALTRVLASKCANKEISFVTMTATPIGDVPCLTSNFDINETTLSSDNDLLTLIAKEDKPKIMMFVPTNKEGAKLKHLLNKATDKNGNSVPYLGHISRQEMQKNTEVYENCRKAEHGFFTCTNIAEMGVNCNPTIVYSSNLVNQPVETHQGSVEMQKRRCTPGMRAQRRGRVGRRAAGQYWELDNSKAVQYDPTVIQTEVEFLVQPFGLTTAPYNHLGWRALNRIVESGKMSLWQAAKLNEIQRDATYLRTHQGCVRYDVCDKCTPICYPFVDTRQHEYYHHRYRNPVGQAMMAVLSTLIIGVYFGLSADNVMMGTAVAKYALTRFSHPQHGSYAHGSRSLIVWMACIKGTLGVSLVQHLNSFGIKPPVITTEFFSMNMETWIFAALLGVIGLITYFSTRRSSTADPYGAKRVVDGPSPVLAMAVTYFLAQTTDPDTMMAALYSSSQIVLFIAYIASAVISPWNSSDPSGKENFSRASWMGAVILIIAMAIHTSKTITPEMILNFGKPPLTGTQEPSTPWWGTIRSPFAPTGHASFAHIFGLAPLVYHISSLIGTTSAYLLASDIKGSPVIFHPTIYHTVTLVTSILALLGGGLHPLYGALPPLAVVAIVGFFLGKGAGYSDAKSHQRTFFVDEPMPELADFTSKSVKDFWRIIVALWICVFGGPVLAAITFLPFLQKQTGFSSLHTVLNTSGISMLLAIASGDLLFAGIAGCSLPIRAGLKAVYYHRLGQEYHGTIEHKGAIYKRMLKTLDKQRFEGFREAGVVKPSRKIDSDSVVGTAPHLGASSIGYFKLKNICELAQASLHGTVIDACCGAGGWSQVALESIRVKKVLGFTYGSTKEGHHAVKSRVAENPRFEGKECNVHYHQIPPCDVLLLDAGEVKEDRRVEVQQTKNWFEFFISRYKAGACKAGIVKLLNPYDGHFMDRLNQLEDEGMDFRIVRSTWSRNTTMEHYFVVGYGSNDWRGELNRSADKLLNHLNRARHKLYDHSIILNLPAPDLPQMAPRTRHASPKLGFELLKPIPLSQEILNKFPNPSPQTFEHWIPRGSRTSSPRGETGISYNHPIRYVTQPFFGSDGWGLTSTCPAETLAMFRRKIDKSPVEDHQHWGIITKVYEWFSGHVRSKGFKLRRLSYEEVVEQLRNKADIGPLQYANAATALEDDNFRVLCEQRYDEMCRGICNFQPFNTMGKKEKKELVQGADRGSRMIAFGDLVTRVVEQMLLGHVNSAHLAAPPYTPGGVCTTPQSEYGEILYKRGQYQGSTTHLHPIADDTQRFDVCQAEGMLNIESRFFMSLTDDPAHKEGIKTLYRWYTHPYIILRVPGGPTRDHEILLSGRGQRLSGCVVTYAGNTITNMVVTTAHMATVTGHGEERWEDFMSRCTISGDDKVIFLEDDELACVDNVHFWNDIGWTRKGIPAQSPSRVLPCLQDVSFCSHEPLLLNMKDAYGRRFDKVVMARSLRTILRKAGLCVGYISPDKEIQAAQAKAVWMSILMQYWFIRDVRLTAQVGLSALNPFTVPMGKTIAPELRGEAWIDKNRMLEIIKNINFGPKAVRERDISIDSWGDLPYVNINDDLRKDGVVHGKLADGTDRATWKRNVQRVIDSIKGIWNPNGPTENWLEDRRDMQHLRSEDIFC